MKDITIGGPHCVRGPQRAENIPGGAVALEAMAELQRARAGHPVPMRSYAEGWAILYEEVDELWDEVRKRPFEIDKDAIRREAIQVAAMALRFVEDLC